MRTTEQMCLEVWTFGPFANFLELTLCSKMFLLLDTTLLSVCLICDLLSYPFPFLVLKAEETEFQQARHRNSDWIFLFPSQQPLPQWGSQRWVSQEVRHHSLPGEKPLEEQACSLDWWSLMGVLEVLLGPSGPVRSTGESLERGQ